MNIELGDIDEDMLPDPDSLPSAFTGGSNGFSFNFG